MKKTAIKLTIFLTLFLLLVGCSKVSDTKDTKPQKTETSKVNQTKNPTDTKENELWNDAKSKRLANFMHQFSQDMNQDYKSYTPNHNVNFYGVKFPNFFSENKIKVDNQHVSVAWSEKGKKVADYSVVAVYSDIESSKYTFGNHLYLFAIKDQKPVVLITEQNQGMPDEMIHFDLSKNENLKTQFSTIFNGQDK